MTGYAIDGDHLYENTWEDGDDLNDANKWGVKSRVLFDGETNPDRSLVPKARRSSWRNCVGQTPPPFS